METVGVIVPQDFLVIIVRLHRIVLLDLEANLANMKVL